MKTTGTIITLFLFAIVLTSCDNFGSSSREKSPEELKMELKQQELANPIDYLSVDGTYRENFWGDKLKLEYTIRNKATLATYKDVVIKVGYYSKTKTLLGTKDYTIYEIFRPSSSKSLELKIDNYKDVKSISLDIVKAIPMR